MEAQQEAGAESSTLALRHFTACPRRTGSSAVVIVPADAAVSSSGGALSVGDEVAVVAPDGSCAGAAVWDGDGVAVTVWEDDPFTPERDGLFPGDPLSFVSYDASEGAVVANLQVSYEPEFRADAGFSRDALYIVGVGATNGGTGTGAPTFALDQNYPNPVRSRTTVPFSVAEAGPVTLEVFDALGRLVARPVEEHRAAGAHEVSLDAAGLAPGLYVYRLTAGGDVRQRSLTVVR